MTAPPAGHVPFAPVVCPQLTHTTFANTRHRRKKFEIATDEVGNFIKQDEKKGVLREVSACGFLCTFVLHAMFLHAAD